MFGCSPASVGFPGIIFPSLSFQDVLVSVLGVDGFGETGFEGFGESGFDGFGDSGFDGFGDSGVEEDFLVYT